MKINKSIAVLAMSASSAFALIGPNPNLQKKTICLNVHENAKGVLFAGSCDESRNNKIQGLDLLANGCAADQVSVVATKFSANTKFNVQVNSCLPPNIVQL